MLFSSASANGPIKTILIVDDDRMIVELLAIGFEKHGFKVFKAYNGLEALSIFSHETIEFVLTDIQMPVMNGSKLAHRIKDQSPFTKIAVMSGGLHDEATALLQNEKADYFFPKPFSIKSICQIIAAEAQAA